MNPEQISVAALRGLWGADSDGPGDTDYRLLAEIEDAFAARSRNGLPALVVPMKGLGAAPVGRRG